MSEQNWYVNHGGKEHGPFNAKQLKKLAESGQITAETPFCLDRSGDWKPAGKVSGLFSVVSPTIPVAAVAPTSRGDNSSVQFLKTTGVSHQLEKIIDEAKEFLYLVSPYLKIAERLRQSLDACDRLKLDIRVIYGKSELQPEQLSWLRSLRSLRTGFCQNLHAKCYMNEKVALVTSMNLYEFSQINNHEMGILVTKDGCPTLYAEILEETRRLIRISEDVILPFDRPVSVAEESRTGFCIRCRKVIAADPSAPYCADCYRTWKRYENPNYKEKHCHACGKEHDSTLKKPLCLSCFKQS